MTKSKNTNPRNPTMRRDAVARCREKQEEIKRLFNAIETRVDADKDEGRHHALDLYRIIAMLTESEDVAANELAVRHADNPVIGEAARVIDELIAAPRGLGRIRLREHPLCPADADPDWLAAELRRLLGVRR